MKKLIFSLLFLCLFCTCKKDNYSSMCGGRNPVQNLPWLQAKILSLKKNNLAASIYRGEYQGRTLYFVSTYCCDTCSCVGALPYDCDGNPVHLSEAQYNDVTYNSQLLYRQVIWQK